MIVWAYSCWHDGVGFGIASLSLIFGVADLCGCLYCGGFRDVGRNTCSGIPLPQRYLKGEAAALAVCMHLMDVPVQDQEHELPKIIAETYSSIGRDSLGARPIKQQLQGRSYKDSAKQAPEGSKKTLE
ncbi:hypothetical protein NDU88_008113 [Pleurodeles waltl]|uniref:Uncharacterized protein n=1 Tax=Pleurodeles waltl TaxID=8319 RepID=A0AAV7PN78_PLEWA|nr:hypothetical protein NDU88_008113 [Pleurodeles waltl]